MTRFRCKTCGFTTAEPDAHRFRHPPKWELADGEAKQASEGDWFEQLLVVQKPETD